MSTPSSQRFHKHSELDHSSCEKHHLGNLTPHGIRRRRDRPRKMPKLEKFSVQFKFKPKLRQDRPCTTKYDPV